MTVEIGGNTTNLSKALQDVNKKSSSLQNELNKVNKLLKLDPTNVTLLNQKQEILNEAIKETAEKLKTLKAAYDQTDENDVGTENYRELERQIAATELKLKDYRGQLAGVSEVTKDAKKETEEFRNSAVACDAVISIAKNIVQAVQQVVQAFEEAAIAAAEYADNINTLAAEYQISTESLQRYQYAADIVDVSVETFGASIGRLSKNMGKAADGTGEQAEAFENLGVAITDSNGNLRDSEDVFYDVIDALGAMDNETEANVAANALFGRSFQELNPLVSAGTTKLRQLGAEAEAVGYVIDQDVLDSTNEFQDTLDRMANLTDLATRKFSTGMTPALNKVGEALNKTLASSSVQRMLEKCGEVVGEIAGFFGNLAAKLLSSMPAIVTLVSGLLTMIISFNFSKIVAGINSIKTALTEMSTSNIVGLIATVVSIVASLVITLISSETLLTDCLTADMQVAVHGQST